MLDFHLELDGIFRPSKFPIRCELTGVWYHLFDSEDRDEKIRGSWTGECSEECCCPKYTGRNVWQIR